MKRFAFFLIACLSVGTAQKVPKPYPASATFSAAEIAIYADFLKTWNRDAKSPLNVADTTEPFVNRDEKAEFGAQGCLRGFSKLKPGDGTHHLPPELNLVSNIRLVDPAKHRRRDPGEEIRNGAPVDDAVDAGIANGLFTLSELRFDQTRTLAAFNYSFVCGSLCGSGGTVVYELRSGRWNRSKRKCAMYMN